MILHVALKLIGKKVKDGDTERPVKLPGGCVGVFMVFDSIESAQEYWGNDVVLVQVEEIEPQKASK